MINYIRYFLYGVLALLFLALWNAWQLSHTPAPTAQSISAPQSSAILPTSASTPISVSSPIPLGNQTISMPGKIIHVKTNVLNVDINLSGGDVVEADLWKYPESIHSARPIALLANDDQLFYIAQSGLLSSTGSAEALQYTASKETYSLAEGQDQLDVVLQAKTKSGLIVEKHYLFKPNQYAIDISMQVKNASGRLWTGSFFTQFLRKDTGTGQAKMFRVNSFLGAAVSSAENPYQKFPLNKIGENPISQDISNGWLALVQHYFVGVWIPVRDVAQHYYSSETPEGVVTMGIASPMTAVAPSQSTQFHSTLYVGPKIASVLSQVAPHLELTVDYGHLWVIAIVIFKMLSFIHRFVGNWGWSIILVTIAIRLLFYKLAETSYRSMAAMRKLQPKIAQLKEQLGNDKQAMSKAMMELYKREKVNPLGGCLPILVQIPVFIALYWVLLESVELRQAPFIFWIQDLSAKDPYYVLPILMGISMYVQQKLSPAPPDPTQAKMMMFLPIMFTALFMNFPAGLVLYWLVNNLLSIAQQVYITRKFDRGDYRKSTQSKKAEWMVNANRKR
ncbi:MAG: membrane protein insertase YidC [Gammaproteobacteria bacterium GWF2_41_13]|nr:MAG: membrane protein insertase YidC [Gammaproteobacteria bacterium GWF2_41_13]